MRRFIHETMEDVDRPVEERELVFEERKAYFDAQIEDHIAHPRDNLTSFLIEAEIAGEKLSPAHIRGTLTLLMIAGIDTTWSAMGLAVAPGPASRGPRGWPPAPA